MAETFYVHLDFVDKNGKTVGPLTCLSYVYGAVDVARWKIF
jgi:hypothetical protein